VIGKRIGVTTYRSSSTTKAHNGGSSSVVWVDALRLPVPVAETASEGLRDDSPEVDHSDSRLCSFIVAASAIAVCWSYDESVEDPESGGG
jgi:hypothetical protein